MRHVDTLNPPVSQAISRRGRRFGPRWLTIAAVVVAILLVIGFGLLVLNWPFKKQGIIDALQQSSVKYVTIRHFYRTYFPPGCVSEDVRFLQANDQRKPALITIRRLTIQGSYARILTFQKHLSLVRVEGMHLTILPKGPGGGPGVTMPITHTKSPRGMDIGTVIADGTVLDFLPSDAGGKPFHLIVNKLALDGVGRNEPLSYRATMINPEPPGEVQSTGRFGPWNPGDPGRTAITGSYTLRNANLAFFKAISGTLSSNGKFSGMLDHIELAGTTDTPNFKVSRSSHTRQVTTEFHAAVDATDGNTFLENVIGHFDRTTLAGTGRIAGEDGKITSLEIFATGGRIEDLLNLFVSANHPPMTGSVSFRTHVEFPPDSQSFIRKLKLVGDFGIGGGKFVNANTQGEIGHLSESAEKAEKEEPPENPATVVSNLKGHVVMGDGIATLSNVSFSIPGAFARLHGTYNLTDYRVDLRGTLVTRGKLSKATSGMKSVLVAAISPLFRRRASLKVVPFKITGPYGHTTVSLDISAKNRKHHRARQ